MEVKRKMSARAGKLASIVLLVLLGSMPRPQTVLAGPTDPEVEPIQNPFESIQKIYTKLNKYQVGKPPTVSKDELIKAFEQFNSWTDDQKKAVRSLKEYRYVIDIALAPMQLADPPSVETIHKYYKEYEYVYLDGYHLGVQPMRLNKEKKTETLYFKLIGLGRTPLVYDDFVEAKKEAVFLLDELNDLVEKGLIYKKKTEFEERVNFLNYNLFLPLFTDVYPAMKYLDDAEALRLLYLEKFHLTGKLLIGNGKVVDINRWHNTPGFLHVV